MKTTKILLISILALCLMVLTGQLCEAAEMGTAFTYQGHLYDANDVANGEYDFHFKLYDANVGGGQAGSDVNKPDVDVIDAYFTVELDFGSDVFDGNERWLEIGIRPGEENDPCAYTTLVPRQEITPTPYALYAKTAGAGHSLDAADGSPTDAVYVDNNGRVGIGTQSPTSLLEIASSDSGVIDSLKLRTYQGSGGSGVKINFGIGAVTGGKIENIFAGDEADLIFSSYSNSGGLSEKMRITGGGNVGIGTTSPSHELNVVGDANITGSLYAGSGSTVLFVDDATDRVGIGTTSPAETLDVNGTVQISGFKMSTGSANNYVLTSDASGAGTWQAAGGGGDDLGNHIATQNIELNGNWLSGDGDNQGVFVNNAGGNVGIGTANPQSKLSVGGDGFANTGVYGTSSSNGGYFEANDSNGRGVVGYATDTGNVFNYGGHFTAAGSNGRGVYGEASGSSGKGVYGYASNSGSVNNHGGYFKAVGSSGYGVLGWASGSSGRGVYGYASNSGSVTNYGGYFTATGSTGRGVYGLAIASSGVNYGVYGKTYSSSGYAGYFDGRVKATGKIKADQGVEMPLTYYEVMAPTATEVTVTTAVHNFCALTKLSLQTADPGTFKGGEVVPNGDGTWTLKARGGGTSQDTVIAGCQCF